MKFGLVSSRLGATMGGSSRQLGQGLLPKIGQALRQFVAPIKVSPVGQATHQGVQAKTDQEPFKKQGKNPSRHKSEDPTKKDSSPQEQPDFQRHDSKQNPSGKPKLRLIKSEEVTSKELTSTHHQKSLLGFHQTILQLLQMFPFKGGRLFKFLAFQSYSKLLKDKSKDANIGKGAFVDHKAE